VKFAFAALKIVATVVIHRLRKLEMANSVAAVSLAVALRLPWLEIGYRAAFALLLNALVYLNNDYLDVELDLESPDKDRASARFLADHAKAALAAQLILVALLAGAAVLLDPGLLVALIVGGGICWWYSARLKRVPYLDVAAMMVWGSAMPLLGAPLDHALGWAMAVQLGLFSGVFESIQVIRDADDDAAQGVRTTAVALGKSKTLVLVRALMVAATAYLFLVVHPAAALISLGALLIPFEVNRVVRYWTRVKIVYGAAWVFVCGSVFFSGRSGGVLWEVERAAVSRAERPALFAELRAARN
jgi:4-hydroxybenzoate polyprenyltransferase